MTEEKLRVLVSDMIHDLERFALVKTENGWHCRNLGEWFQAQCRTPEWRAAMIVYDKYKRKLNLENHHLLELRDYICGFSRERQSSGKPPSKEFLTQEASAYCRRTWMTDKQD